MATQKKFKVDWGSTMQKIKDQETAKKGKQKDDRFYYPQMKEDGTAHATLRFLQSKDTDVPFVKVYQHYFNGPGGWLIENCPTTLGNECPVCKANGELWNDDPDTVRKRSRVVRYFANVLVVKDPQNPENEGKVFLFKYGKKIQAMLMEKLSPAEDIGETPVMIFDYYEGSNFKLNIKQVKVFNQTMPNYDSSRFEDMVTAIGDDETIEKVHSSLHGLAEFVDVHQFKDFNEISERYEKVVGNKPTGASTPVPASTSTSTTEKAADASSTSEEAFDGSDDAFFDALKEGSDS